MTLKYDIFISYAHLDDRSALGDAEKGWIDLLEDRLSVLVSQALGSEVSIWRDGHNLQGNDELQGAIGEGVTSSLVLVPVISPRYVQSDWCNREISTFCTSASTSSGAPGFRSRVFKVNKTPLPDPLKKLEPEQIRSSTGYTFYGEDENRKLQEYSPDPKDKSYWKELTRLVSEIASKLIELKYSAATEKVAATTAGGTSAATVLATVRPNTGDAISKNGGSAPKVVYLAETTSDVTKERELVRDELQQRGHVVLPEQKLPQQEVKLTEAAVRADLVRSALSVHLVGTRYGSTPEDDARSIVRIQEELGAERGKEDPAFVRLLWMPPGMATPALEISDERQKSFIAELQTRVTAGAELLQTSVEDLKTRIIEKLIPPVTATAETDRRRRLKQVYLICENRDRPFVRPLKEYLFNQKFEVITWLDEGTADRLMEYHHKNLRECDAALIYFGCGDEPWVRKNLEDLQKAYGYGRESDWLANAVYVGAPENEQKEDFLTHLVPYVIRNFNSFDPSDLRDFVGAVQAAEGGH
jgi:hypothetical protein